MSLPANHCGQSCLCKVAVIQVLCSVDVVTSINIHRSQHSLKQVSHHMRCWVQIIWLEGLANYKVLPQVKLVSIFDTGGSVHQRLPCFVKAAWLIIQELCVCIVAHNHFQHCVTQPSQSCIVYLANRRVYESESQQVCVIECVPAACTVTFSTFLMAA